MTLQTALADTTHTTPTAVPELTDAEKAAVARGDVVVPSDKAPAAQTSLDDTSAEDAAAAAAMAAAEAAAVPAKEEAKDAAPPQDKEPAKEEAKEPVETVIETARDPETGRFAKKEEAEGGIVIPKARFDAAQRKSKETIERLEAELEAVRRRYATPEGQTIETLEKALDEKTTEYNNLMSDGKLDEAAGIMRDMNRLNRQIAALEMAPKAQARDTEVVAKSALDTLIEHYEATFPSLNHKHAAYDEEQVRFVANKQARYEASGMTAAEALQEAVEDAVYRFGLLSDDAPAAPEAPAAKPKVEPPSKEAQTKAKVDMAKGHPASLSNIGLEGDAVGLTKPNVKDMPYEDFDKLPEATKKRLRGDEF